MFSYHPNHLIPYVGRWSLLVDDAVGCVWVLAGPNWGATMTPPAWNGWPKFTF